jgi:hypothetical protein
MEEKNKKPDQKENTRERNSQSDPITQSANPKLSHGRAGRSAGLKRACPWGARTGRQKSEQRRNDACIGSHHGQKRGETRREALLSGPCGRDREQTGGRGADQPERILDYFSVRSHRKITLWQYLVFLMSTGGTSSRARSGRIN